MDPEVLLTHDDFVRGLAAGLVYGAADVDTLRRELSEHIDATTPLIPAGDSDRETQPALGFQRVLQRALYHVQSAGKDEVLGANVLVAIFSEKQSQAVYFLGLQDITRLDVVNYISHGMPQVSGEGGEEDDRDILSLGMVFEPFAGLKAVHFGHVQVGDNERDGMFF